MRRGTFLEKHNNKKDQPVVIIASGIAKVRKWWSYSLQDFFSLKEASDWEKLRASMTNHNSSILLLDIALLQPHGMDRILELRNLFLSIKIILLTSVYNEKEAVSAFKAGVKGYCHKDIDPFFLKKAVEVVQKGEVWVGRKTISNLLSELTSHTENRQQNPPNLAKVCLDYLTRREHQIARMVGDGAHNKEIARRLDISERTVKAHLTAIFQKLQIPDRLRLGLFVAGQNLDNVHPSSPSKKDFNNPL